MLLKKLTKWAISVLILTLIITGNGCSHATIRNGYEKSGPVSEYQGEGDYYHSRIRITTPENGEQIVIIPEVIDEGGPNRPFPGISPYPFSYNRQYRQPYNDPCPLPREIH